MLPLSKALASQPILGEARLVELTQCLIHHGARTQVIVALTGLSEKKVRGIIKSFNDNKPLVRGPCQFPTAEFFAGALRKRNPNANLHSAIFLSRYLKLRDSSFSEPMHEGFLLAIAYQGYLDVLRDVDEWRLTQDRGNSAWMEALRPETNIDAGAIEPVLDFNRAFALVRTYDSKELNLVACASCEVTYLALQWVERDAVTCPICAKTSHKKLLAEVGKQGGRRKTVLSGSDKTIRRATVAEMALS